MTRNIPTILVGVYLALVVLGIIPIFTGDDALSGIFAVVLTLPWSSLLGNLTGGSVIAGLVVIVVGAAINAAIIYFVSPWVVGRLIK